MNRGESLIKRCQEKVDAAITEYDECGCELDKTNDDNTIYSLLMKASEAQSQIEKYQELAAKIQSKLDGGIKINDGGGE